MSQEKKYALRFPRIVSVGGGLSLLKGWKNAAPVRPHWRIWWNLESGAAIGFGDSLFELVPDKVVLVPPHVRIQHVCRKQVLSLAMHLEIEEPVDPTLNEVFYINVPQRLRSRLGHLADAYPQRGTGRSVGTSLLIGEIVSCLLQLLPDRVWTVAPRDPRVEDSLDVLRTLDEDACTNERLAQAACMSKNAFIRLFSQSMGTPPQAFLQRLRLDKAARMLTQSDESVETIAEECGFCDRNYLSKLFRRRFGVGPARYRKQGGE